jgi:hypothetical protein
MAEGGNSATPARRGSQRTRPTSQNVTAPDSISDNAGQAKILLIEMNFIYPVVIVPVALLLYDKNDVGIVNHEHFSPMPVSAIALILTVVITLTDLILDEYCS